MGGDAEGGEEKGEGVDEPEEGEEGGDGVDEARERLLGDDGVLFDELGEVVEAGCCSGGGACQLYGRAADGRATGVPMARTINTKPPIRPT